MTLEPPRDPLGARPRFGGPVLRVPSSPQRDLFLEEAAALLIYLEEGGATARPRADDGDGSEHVLFLVNRARFQQLAAELRAARAGAPWVWFPRAGMRRQRPVTAGAAPPSRPNALELRLPMASGELRLTKLHQVALAVTDLDRSITFYRDKLGAEFSMKFDPPGLAFFDLGGTRLMLDAVAEAAGHASPLYFWVDDINAAHATLQSRGVEFEEGPQLINRTDEGTEEWMAFFRDPDDNILAIATQRQL